MSAVAATQTARPAPEAATVEVFHQTDTLTRERPVSPEPPQHPPPRPRRHRRGPSDIQPRPGRIHGLDGLRAIAVVGVLVFHFLPPMLPGGYLGVDVFFVVSGFLITTLLLRELAKAGRIDLPAFWLRRARRLLPALVVVVVLSIGTARLVGGDLLVHIGRQALGALTFSSNWLEIGAGASYFDKTSPLLFLNFWSLAVEEQFYLLWPLGLGLVLALTRTLRHRLAFAGALVVGSAVAMAMLHTPDTDATRVYYGTDTHLFGLALGIGLAFAWADPSRAGLRSGVWRRWRPVAVLAALGTLIALMALLDETNPLTFRGGILLSCIATTVLIAALLESGSLWRRTMALRPLAYVGERSYGIYLWHWPVLIILTAAVPYAADTLRGWLVVAAALVLTLTLAELSYRYVETPVRRDGFAVTLRRLGAWAVTPWELSYRPRLVAGGVAGVMLLSGVAVATAPEKSATQEAIERSEAKLDAGPAVPSPAGVAAAPTADESADAAQKGVLGGLLGAATSVAPALDGQAGKSDGKDAGKTSGGEAGKTSGKGAVGPFGYHKDKEGLWVPRGKELTAIGDSLIVTSADGLEHRFPGIDFAAKSNRQWKDAQGVLEKELAAGTVRDNVIVDFGSNAGVDEGKLRTFLDTLGAGRQVVVVNLYGPLGFTSESNDIVAKVVKDYPNAVVGDWHAAASAQPETLQSDRVHPDIAGMHVYARMVAEAFDQLAQRHTG